MFDLNEVYPNKGESKSDFINRFMRVTAKEYPDVKQRYAVAHSYWDRRNKNEGLFDEYEYKEPEKVSDLIGVDTLYHATYKPYWEEIKKAGFIKPGAHQNWGDVFKTKNNIYLSKDYYNALSYAETAEEVPEELLNQIVVLEIDADKLDVDHLDPDSNQVYDYDGEVQLEDPLTWVELQYDLPIPVSFVKKVHDESKLDEAYLDPEEKFWDYRTSKIENEEIFDETRSESGYGQSYIDNLDKEYKGKISHIEYLTPREYFEKCAEGFNSSFENQIRQIRADKEILNHLKEVITKYNKKFPITYLDYSRNDFRQEGRHRMYVAGELIDWDKKFPVLIIKDADKTLNLNIRRNKPSISHRLERYVLEDEARGAILYGNSAYDMLINLQNIEDSLDKDTFNLLWDFIYDHKKDFK